LGAVAHERMLEITEKCDDSYPNAMKSWLVNWDVISPIFKFSSDVRKVIYTTNAIESLNRFLIALTLILSHKYGYECYMNEFFYSIILIPISLIVFDNIWNYFLT